MLPNIQPDPTRQSTMERMPVEVLVLIFDRVPLGQLDECRRVCKCWLFVIENLMEFDCLVIYRISPPFNQRLFHTDRPPSLRHCVLVESEDLSEFKKRIFRKFRRTYIHYTYRFIIFDNFPPPSPRNLHQTEMRLQRSFVYPRLCQWSFLNTWPQLEELHLGTVRLDEDFRLVIPNLKVFQVERIYRGILTLDTPQLTQLRIDAFGPLAPGNLALVHPETVENFRMTGDLLFRDRFVELWSA